MNFEKAKDKVDRSNVLAHDLWNYLTKNYGNNSKYNDPKIVMFALASVANTIAYCEDDSDDRFKLKMSFVMIFQKLLMNEFDETKENNVRGH